MKLAIVLTGLGFAVAVAITAMAQTSAPRVPKKIDSPGLPNAFQVTDKVLSGGQPDGDVGYAALEKLGVKTVVSVDGARPDVATAKKYGLRYVHLPHGYDGIPHDRLLDLAKAVRDLPGPIYVHCHHGKHRSPAAAAAACVEVGALAPDEALAVLKAAGTSPDYRGLFRTVRDARPLDGKTLDERRVEFHEVVPVAPLAEAMVAVEHAHDHLKQAAAAGWKQPADHPDIDPPHEALLLTEHFAELLRTDEVQRQPKGFIDILQRSQADSQKLQNALKKRELGVGELTALFDRITADCKSCHTAYRDVPIQEKESSQ